MYKSLVLDERIGVYDLMCKDEKGNFFIIEIQLDAHKNHIQHSKAYASKVFNTSEKYTFSSSPTIYYIVFSENNVFQNPTQYYHIAASKKENDKHIVYVYIEINKFNKQKSEIKSDLDKLIFVMKNSENIQDTNGLQISTHDDFVDVVLKKFNTITMTSEQRLFLDIAIAKNEAILEMTVSHDDDLVNKLILGFVENLKEKGMPSDEISEVTGLTLKEIEELQK